MNPIQTDEYSVEYHQNTNTILFSGAIQLNGREEYKDIVNFVAQSIEASGYTINWDFSQLNNLNSSGQGQLYRLLLTFNKEQHNEGGSLNLSLKGHADILWQQKFMPNVKRMIPKTRLYFT